MNYEQLKTNIKTVVYTEKNYRLTSNLVVVYNYADGVSTGTHFEFEAKVLQPIEKNISPFYASPEFMTEVFEKGLNPFNESSGYAIDSKTKIPEDVNEIDVSRIFLRYSYAGLLFALDEQIIALPYYCDYLHGNFTKSSYHLDKLLPYLQQHPMVIKDYSNYKNKNFLTISDIPYYNNYDGKGKDISFVVIPESKSYNELFLKAFKKVSADNEYAFSIELKEMIIGQYGLMAHGVDYLGLEPFRKTKKKKE